MSKGLVGFCHLVGIFFLFDSCASIVESVHQFSGKLFFHRTFAAFTSVADSPADAEGQAAVSAYFNGNLVRMRRIR